MKHYQKYVNILVFIIIVSISFQMEYYPFMVDQKVTATLSEAVKREDALYQEIESKKKEFEELPQDAYIDKIWKKTPGRNGLEVDLEKSYENMKEQKTFDAALLEFKQVAPDIKMSDLPAAPIYRGHPEKEMVALLINVSWGTEYIPDILKILNEHKVKASFFIEGKWAKENAELVMMIKEQGHVIGNHAYNHPDMARISNQNIMEQITQTNDILSAITGEKPKWFAPPSGSFNDQVVQTAHHLDMETILWTVDTIDWKNPSINVMIDRVNDKVHNGATILMHPTEVIANGLDELIQILKDSGYRIGTIDKLLSEER
ncbi:hypothetical protein D8M04_10935 [Oceanobacillus piezotolerans]|uniref:NodB homology domain-containing protein n=1 Tax=Oceanobacillus piezotolerans TaxID=2448030 RepID=A0A498D9Q8_9BACI|nr:polysaccharide deacetylase family protein [Oceanobacillus piezotolerans]RLL45361.1 hypothetical protein D8M04_10935 [Oceanobacillus piezotolerans]